MLRPLILAMFSVFPFISGAREKGGCMASEKEIYAIIQTIIREEHLDKKSGLSIKPITSFTIDDSDSAFLQTLLIRTQKPDTIGYDTLRGIPITALSFSYPETNLLTQSDINELMCSKQHAPKMQWKRQQFSFSSDNHKEAYGFSVPCFNAAHNIAVVRYDFFCPGLCGTAETLVLKKEARRWHIHVVASAIS